MTTLNAAFLKAQFNDSSISNTNAEVVLDGAINLLNTFGGGLSNLVGVAESKSGTYTSAEAGAIMAVALQIYRENYKHADNATGGVGALNQTFSTTNQLLSFAKALAWQLKGRSFERI